MCFLWLCIVLYNRRLLLLGRICFLVGRCEAGNTVDISHSSCCKLDTIMYVLLYQYSTDVWIIHGKFLNCHSLKKVSSFIFSGSVWDTKILQCLWLATAWLLRLTFLVPHCRPAGHQAEWNQFHNQFSYLSKLTHQNSELLRWNTRSLLLARTNKDPLLSCHTILSHITVIGIKLAPPHLYWHRTSSLYLCALLHSNVNIHLSPMVTYASEKVVCAFL